MIKFRTKGEESLRTLIITLEDGREIEVFASTKGYDGADTQYEVTIGEVVCYSD